MLKDGDDIKFAIGPLSESGDPGAVFYTADSTSATADLLRDLNSAEGLLAPRVSRVSLEPMKRRISDLLVGNLNATNRSPRPLKVNDNRPLGLNGPRVVAAGHLVKGVAAYVVANPVVRALNDWVTPDPMFIPTLDKGLKSEPLKTSKIATAIRQTGIDVLQIKIQKAPVTPTQRKYGNLALAHSRESSLDNGIPATLQDSVLSSWAEGKHVWRMDLKMSRGLVSAFKLDVSQLTFQPAQEATAWERQLDRDEEDLRPYPYLYTLSELLSVLNTVFLPPSGAN